MKKVIMLLFMVVGFREAGLACDICGCGAGSYYIGILPEFNSKIAGIRYRSNYLQTHLGQGGTTSYLTTDEHYRTTELWAGWTFKEKFRLMGWLPLSLNSKANQEEHLSKTGLGDAAVQGFYQLFNRRITAGKESNKLMIHDVWVGGGLKLPTGKYEPKDREEAGKSANLFQLGTGSLDFMLTAMYDLRFQDAGFNLTGSYKINTTNKYSYYYGNRFSGSAQVYYKFRVKNAITLSPNIGVTYESSHKDLDHGYAVFTSGGQVVFGTLGTELTYKKVALGGNWQPAVQQNLAQGAVRAHYKMMLHVSLMF